MSKYFDTKPGSLEEAVSAAQQAAIAISKKERGEKPKKENNFIYAAKMAKKNGEKTFTIGGKTYDVDEALENNRLKEYVEIDGTKRRVKEGDNRLKANRAETNKNDKSDDGDGLDAVQPKAVKKKFKDRKDKDIDNDGDVDSTDKYLHKRRKAISKSMGESLMSVAESVKAMWDEAAKKTESQDMEQDKDGDGMDDDGKAKKTAKKTDSGKDMTPVDTSPKMPKTKTEKNKV